MILFFPILTVAGFIFGGAAAGFSLLALWLVLAVISESY